MKNTEAYIKALNKLSEANKAVMLIEAKIEIKKINIIQKNKEYAACKNEAERKAVLGASIKEYDDLIEAQMLKEEAATDFKIAEIMWKSEKYDIIEKVGRIL